MTRDLAPCLVLLVLVLGGCQRSQPTSWQPVLEETSIAPLREDAGWVRRKAQEARQALPQEPERAAELLDRALERLDRLVEYDLPLQEAREEAQNAYRLLAMDRVPESAELLQRVEDALLAMSERGGEPLARELRRALDAVAEARQALAADEADAPRKVARLAEELNYLDLRRELVMPGEAPD